MQGLIMKPDIENGIKCYVDADFAGGRNQEKCKEPGLVLLRTGYVITYDNLLVIWEIRIQKVITLSTTEAEYIALSQETRDILPFLSLMKEIDFIIKL